MAIKKPKDPSVNKGILVPTLSDLPADPALVLYVLKRLEESVKDSIVNIRSAVVRENNLPEVPVKDTTPEFILRGGLGFGDLVVKWGVTKGTDEFNEEKAETVLREALGEEHFNFLFTEMVLKRKEGSTNPPRELLEEMDKYFTVTRVTDLTAAKAKAAPVSEEVYKKCLTKAPDYYRVSYPTKISNVELIAKLKETGANVGQLLLPMVETT